MHLRLPWVSHAAMSAESGVLETYCPLEAKASSKGGNLTAPLQPLMIPATPSGSLFTHTACSRLLPGIDKSILHQTWQNQLFISARLLLCLSQLVMQKLHCLMPGCRKGDPDLVEDFMGSTTMAVVIDAGCYLRKPFASKCLFQSYVELPCRTEGE